MGFTLDRLRVDLQVPPRVRLDDDLLFAICQANRDCRIERTAKMREYQANGVRLGWLILPTQRQVYCYPEQGPGQRLDHPDTLTNAAILPGLTLHLAGIWATGFQAP